MAIVGTTNVTIELANGGWALQSLEAVAFDGGCWLVPEWTLSPDGTARRPSRLVSLTMVETGAPATDLEAFTGYPIPETVLTDGHVPLSLSRLFLVREAPDLWLPTQDGR
jgi:hypothetical protein